VNENDGDDGLFSSYTDDKDNWPEIVGTQPESEKKPEPPKPLEVVTPPVPEPVKSETKDIELEVEKKPEVKKEKTTEPVFTIEEPTETDKLAEQLVEEHGVYDPTLDLSGYKIPPLELLREYETGKVQVTQEELNQNKDRIVATLINFK